MAENYLFEPRRRDGKELMNTIDLIQETARSTGAQTIETDETIRPYSTRTWGEVFRMKLPPLIHFLGNCLALGRLGVFFGQGGLGKSRISMNISRNQVLGLPFGGMSTGDKPLRHLHMGSENAIHRLQSDIRAMSGGLSQEQQDLLAEHIFLATLELPDDPYVNLADPANVERWRATIEARAPDVLWVDPWGDVQAGESNADSDARWTISELTRLARTANHNAAVSVLAHSRTGVKNIIQAVGYDAANFGKGSKALYSCARCVFNLAPADESETPPVLVYCAKNNDGPRVAPFVLRLDTEHMLYELDEGFDLDAWASDLQARGNGKRPVKKPVRLTDVQAMEIFASEAMTKTQAHNLLRDRGASRDDAPDIVRRLLAAGTLEQWQPSGKNQPTYVGTPDAVRQRREQWNIDRQKQLPV